MQPFDSIEAGAEFLAHGVENVGTAIVNDPIADLEIATGVVLAATGVGTAAGAGLIARGGIALASGTLSAAEKDDPKVRGGVTAVALAEKQHAEALRAQELARAQAQAQAATAAGPRVGGRAESKRTPRADPSAKPPPAAVKKLGFFDELLLAIEEFFGGTK